MLKRNPADNKKKKRDRISINFNRKILGISTLNTLRDSIDLNGSLRGDAIVGVVDDLIKLRYLCENIVESYEDGDKENALSGLEMLKLIL